MNILVSVKRVPDTGSKLELTSDERAVDTTNLGFTISPHEECAVEEAVRMIENHGGSSTVLTLGPSDGEEVLRASLAKGIDRGLLLETQGDEWDPAQTANAIVEAYQKEKENGNDYQLLLFGNESADSGDFQVSERVAAALDLPCVAGVKGIEFDGNTVVAKREIATGWEIFDVEPPAVVAVKEGLNLPRHPSLRGRMKAKKKEVTRIEPTKTEVGLEMVRLKHPPEQKKEIQMLGEGAEAAPKVVQVLKDLEVL